MGKAGAQALERNPNWKGGRTVASNGYVLVKAPEPPDAHGTGYIYEHRLVAERVLGRPLRSGEQVHHVDGDRRNNDPANLEVVPSMAEHRLRHRKRQGRRLPSEPNPIVECACGCGITFPRYDELGRPRRYVSGHNPMAAPTRKAIVDALRAGPIRRSDLIARLGLSKHAVAVALSKLRSRNLVVQVRHGVWALPNEGGEARV